MRAWERSRYNPGTDRCLVSVPLENQVQRSRHGSCVQSKCLSLKGFATTELFKWQCLWNETHQIQKGKYFYTFYRAWVPWEWTTANDMYSILQLHARPEAIGSWILIEASVEIKKLKKMNKKTSEEKRSITHGH